MQFKIICRSYFNWFTSVLTCALFAFILADSTLADDAAKERDSASSQVMDALNALDGYMQSIEQLRSHLDRTQIDLDAALESLEYDADQIVQFVTNDIRFEQYSGVLRGALGTLRCRAGNALDQAVLLAGLLKDAGFDARIVRGNLESDQVLPLLESMNHPVEESSPYADQKSYEETLERMWAESGGSSEEMATLMKAGTESAANQVVEEETQFVLQQFRSHNLQFGNPQLENAIVEAARDYYWVEYRPGLSASWLPAHPAFPSGSVPAGELKAVTFYDEEIPPELQHRLRIEVFLEQSVGNKMSRHALTASWERPIANLIDAPMTFTNVPLAFAASPENDEQKIPNPRNELFVPVVSGQTAGNTFDMLGNVIPMDAAASNMAGIFAQDAELLNSATSTLSGLGSQESSSSAMRLVNQSLQFTLIRPNGKETQYWRNVYHNNTGHPPFQNDAEYALVLQALMQHYTIAVSVGRASEAAVLDASLADLQSKRGLIEAALRSQHTEKASKPPTPQSPGSFAWLGTHYTFAALDRGSPDLASSTYRHEPLLFAHRAVLPISTPGSEHTDILHSQHRFRDYTHNGSAVGVAAMVRKGVRESFVEGVLLPANETSRINTLTQFQKYRKENLEFLVLRPGESEALETLNLSPLVQTALDRDLDRGFALLLPMLADGKATLQPHWWRFEPRTGETLGVGPTGEGTAVVTRAIEHRIASGVLVGLLGFGVCEAARGPVNNTFPGLVTHGDCVGLALGMGVGAGGGASIAQGIASWGGFAMVVLVLSKIVDINAPTES